MIGVLTAQRALRLDAKPHDDVEMGIRNPSFEYISSGYFPGDCE